MHQSCPLCNETLTESYSIRQTATRQCRYWLCGACRLLSLEPAQRISAEEEKAHYEKHQNFPENPGYVEFLMRAISELRTEIPPPARGIDYGSGPSPVGSQLLRELDYDVISYDPFFADNAALLPRDCDFVISIEVVEHFHAPLIEFQKIDSLLKAGGVLCIMTLLYPPVAEIENWWYLRDPTHCSCYTEETFRWLAERMNWMVVRIKDRRVIVLRKG